LGGVWRKEHELKRKKVRSQGQGAKSAGVIGGEEEKLTTEFGSQRGDETKRKKKEYSGQQGFKRNLEKCAKGAWVQKKVGEGLPKGGPYR